ncbi:hypothetical protein ACFH04_25865 [Streptomyces noboritoensis]|uniref:Uncharacterized protein n=1 Tax=Streptomyces noboritoensis TaxID=67337 RepID=A0ABV6TPL5_9ACTN
MPETTPNAKGPAPVTLTPEATQPTLTPADQVKPEDIGTLSIEYRDGQPVIVVSGGTYFPADLAVVDPAGNALAAYTAGPASQRVALCSLHSWTYNVFPTDTPGIPRA